MSGDTTIDGFSGLARTGVPRQGEASVMLRALGAQVRVVAVLAFRDIKTRYAQSKLGCLTSVIEPAIHITFIYMLHSFLEREAKFGNSLVLFLASGCVPFFLFTNISTGATGAMRAARSLRSFSITTPLDFVLATALIEFLALAIVYGIVFYCLAEFYAVPEAIPFAPQRLLGAIAAICLLGIGVGLFNAGIGAIFPSWRTIYGRAARIFVLTSGVYFVPEFLPLQFRQYMLLNPLMHAIEWFRAGLFQLYPTFSLDLGYLWTWALATFVLGLSFERVMRVRLAHLSTRR